MVDDDPIQLQIREIVLRSAGLDVQLATDVESALALLRSGGDQIGMVVTDHFLNGCTGADLVRELRLTAPSLPVVVLTGMPGSRCIPISSSKWCRVLFPNKKEFADANSRIRRLTSGLREWTPLVSP